MAMEQALLDQVRKHNNIRILENHTAVEFVTEHHLIEPNNIYNNPRCFGVYALDVESNQVKIFPARITLLSSGGSGQVYLHTTNPDIATGDGIAMAYRAGAAIANMEFMQFHPTCLYHPTAKSYLITEAVRGEGGKLLLPNGTEFAHEFDPRGVLAPRDIVARAIDYKMKQMGVDCVYLDIMR